MLCAFSFPIPKAFGFVVCDVSKTSNSLREKAKGGTWPLIMRLLAVNEKNEHVRSKANWKRGKKEAFPEWVCECARVQCVQREGDQAVSWEGLETPFITRQLRKAKCNVYDSIRIQTSMFSFACHLH